VGQDSDAKKNRQGHDAVSEVRATDALANERTFLAYVRTALGFIGLGFVIARFSLFLHEAAIVAHMSVPSSGLSSAFGAWMALTGVACGLFGGYRYVVSARALRAGNVAGLSTPAAIVIAAAVAIIGGIVAFALPALH
jgi:putative membrane protein